jgi:hypothetical protein
MRRCSALLLLGLALWCGPASAQKVKVKQYSLTVSIHPAVHPSLKQKEIENILKGASDLLQGHTNITPHNNCKVEFKFKGFVPFPGDAPADVNNLDDLEAVHKIPADVKVVQTITFCAPGNRVDGYAGCAWRPELDLPRTVIVARSKFLPGLSSPRGGGIGPVIWAHEFGHTTGVLHRFQDGLTGSDNLMTPCDLQAFSQPITDDECTHFRTGPATSFPSASGDTCPANRTVRHLTD